MMTHYTATETLYMTADRGRVVREDDPAAAEPGASRLVMAGNTLPVSTVERFGLPTIGDQIVGIAKTAITKVIVDAVTDLIEDAVEWIGDKIIDALGGDDEATDPATLADAPQDEPDADVPSIDAPAIEMPSQAIDAIGNDRIETKPITPRKRRSR